MEIMIKGYQYKSNNCYAGEYQFPQHKDQDPIHVPPNTTLIAPPKIPEGKDALWNGLSWSLVDKEIVMSELPSVEIEESVV
jgi:hypothetical protein